MFLLYVVGLPVMALVGVTAVHKRAVVQKKHVMKLKGHKTWVCFILLSDKMHGGGK